MLLAIDTATEAVTVAVADGAHVLAEIHRVDRLRHGELLAPAVADVLRAAGVVPRALTAVAVGVGPGPYTGLRIGLAFATGLAEAIRVPLVGVCTLDVIAFAVAPGLPFTVATDARRREVYWATYDADGHRRTGPAVGPPTTAATDRPTAGNGPLLYPDAFPHPIEPTHPRAGDLARAVATAAVPTLPTVPLYLRRPDADEPGARKRVTAH